MTTIRIMTYNIQRCRGGDGRIDPERILQVIGEGAADIVALQQVDASCQTGHLKFLAERLGMGCYANPRAGANAFLSYYPLRGVQEYELGQGGVCQRADADINGKRMHLFNLRLDCSPVRRQRQIADLLGPCLLGSPSLACPTLVLGDFADMLWGPGNLSLNMNLRKAKRPFWPGTYPANFPLIGRDRAYVRGELKIVASTIERGALARLASTHLPLVLTLEISNTRQFLHLKKINRMEIATG